MDNTKIKSLLAENAIALLEWNKGHIESEPEQVNENINTIATLYSCGLFSEAFNSESDS